MPTFADARALAELVLADHDPARWRRAQDRARAVQRAAERPEVERGPLLQAAVLLEIGHSPVVARTGAPGPDAARFLRSRGYDRRVVDLVAHPDRDDADATRSALRDGDAAVGP